MKKITLLSTVMMFVFTYIASAQQIFADHTKAKLEPITAESIQKAKEVLHIAYTSTSHGSQITKGMETLMESKDLSNLKGYKGNIYSYGNNNDGSVLDLHYHFAMPTAKDLSGGEHKWQQATRDYLDKDENQDVNVVMWSWCNIMGHDVPLYLQRMEELIAEYGEGGTKIKSGERKTPVIFVFMTAHTNYKNNNPDYNKKTFEVNKLIREHCIKNNRVLYDFYDIECYDPDGNYFGDGEKNVDDYGTYQGKKQLSDNCTYNKDEGGRANWATDWQAKHTENVDWFQCNAAHSQPLNGNLKTYAAWWLWTELARVIDKPSVSINGNLSEDNLNGATVSVSLNKETFVAGSLNKADFILNNAPNGTSINSVTKTDNKQATITLSFNGTDFDKDITNFNITVKASALSGADNMTSNNLTIKAVSENDDPKATLIVAESLTEENLNGTKLGIELVNETFTDNTLSSANFVLNNAPNGTTVANVEYSSANKANVTLTFDQTDFDQSINNFSLTIKGVELSSGADLTTNTTSIKAIVEDAKAIISCSTNLQEDNLNDAVIVYTLVDGTFTNRLNANNFILNGHPNGLTISSVTSVNNKKVNVKLAFDDTDFDYVYNGFSITVKANQVSGNTEVRSNELVINALVEEVEIQGANLTEENLNGASVNLVLKNEQFNSNTLNKADFVLNNTPNGVVINNVEWQSKTKAKVIFGFDGTDFSNDVTNCNIMVKSAALSRKDDLTSNNFTIKSKVEVGSPQLTISSSTNLTEENLNNAIINMQLSNVKFSDQTFDKGNFVLNNAPKGTSIKSVQWISDAKAELTLLFDKTDFDTDINNFSITIKQDELQSDKSLTSNNMSIKATVEVGIFDEIVSLKLYPTLVSNGFTIELQNTFEVCLLEIYDQTGKKVKTIKLTSQKQFVNVSSLQAGMYMAKIGNKVIKFVKK